MISNWRNLITRKDLLRELISTELRASTAQRKLGWLWWLIDPLLMMLIYYIIVVKLFGRGRAEYDPYWIFIFVGLVTWKQVTQAITKSAEVLSSNRNLIKAVPFPTMILPLAKVGSSFIFFLFGFGVLALMCLAADLEHHSGDLLPLVQILPLILLQTVLVTGISFAVAVYGLLYRDISGLMPHLLRIGFYLSPGLYGVDAVLEWAQVDCSEGVATALFNAYMLNPFAVLISGYRHALFYGTWLAPQYWLMLIIETALALFLGYRLYKRHDRRVFKFL